MYLIKIVQALAPKFNEQTYKFSMVLMHLISYQIDIMKFEELIYEINSESQIKPTFWPLMKQNRANLRWHGTLKALTSYLTKSML